MVTKAKINEIRDKIAGKIKPEKIILFGSYAKGTQNEDSDIDIAVIVKDKKKSSKRNIEIKRIFFDRTYALDVFSFNNKEIEQLSRISGTMAYEVIKNGKLLYEK